MDFIYIFFDVPYFPYLRNKFYTKYLLIYGGRCFLLSKRHFSVVYFKQGAYVRELVLIVLVKLIL